MLDGRSQACEVWAGIGAFGPKLPSVVMAPQGRFSPVGDIGLFPPIERGQNCGTVEKESRILFYGSLPAYEHLKGSNDMLKSILAFLVTCGTMGAVMAKDRIRISSTWGEVTADIADTDAGAALMDMLPLTIEMRDHLRQEKTGYLPRNIPEGERQQEFGAGTLGLWSGNHFVVYYRDGRVPQPGIRILGQIEGDESIFDRPGNVTVELSRVD